MTSHAPTVGDLLRDWRKRRRLSQLDLASDAEISPRHLSFVETGRAQPSREMILHLAEQLEVPVRERNLLLVAAGFAPMFPERPLGDPALEAARKAVTLVIEAQRPFPAFAVDRHWTVIASNAALPELYVGCSAELLAQPINALRLSLHPEGMAPRIRNLPEWRAHLLAVLRKQVDVTADPVLIELHRELAGYPLSGGRRADPAPPDPEGVVVPLQVATEAGVLSFFSTTTLFGTPVDVTLSEIAIESLFPADAATAALVRRLEEKRAKVG